MSHFLDRFRNVTLGEVFQDKTPVSVHDASLNWLQIPADDFLHYVRTRERFAFDEIPPNPTEFRQPPTFLMAQVHRVWITLQMFARNFTPSPEKVIFDLGAFPFTIDLAMREYLKNPSRIVSFINHTVPVEWANELAGRKIEIRYANLDPLVKPNEPIPPGLTDNLEAETGSVDFVLLAHVIEHLYHPLMVLQEIYRVLKRGGRLLVSTDNAFLLGGFLHYLILNDFLHDKVEGTSAMLYNTWRGHVRFFSMGDLTTLLTHVGFRIVETEYCEVLYNSFIDEYFFHPSSDLPKWKADLLTEFPGYRNEILLVAEK